MSVSSYETLEIKGQRIVGIQVQWDNAERTIICVRASKTRQMADAFGAVQTIYDMIESVEHRVNMIVYIEKTIQLKQGYLQDVDRLEQRFHPRLNRVIVVSPDAFMLDVIHTAEKLLGGFRLKLVFAPSVDAARQQLNTWTNGHLDDGIGAD